MLYYASLYYKRSVFTGANKRFDQLGQLFAEILPDQFRIIVCEGERPDWAPTKNCLFVPPYNTRIQRIRSYFFLQTLLTHLEAGKVITDFMPIPFFGLRKHEHYQLIHDLRNFTEFSRGGLSGLTKYYQKWQLTRSKHIITVSEFSRANIVKYCSIPPQKIIVSYNGIDRKFFLPERNVNNSIDILYVATFEARKNHLTLMRALALAPSGLRVRFIGRDLGTRVEINAMADELVHSKGFEFEFIDSLNEAELIDSYRNARVYVFPSLLEGFGMPLIEALATNCRVACSDIEVFRELCEGKAFFFDPHSARDMWRGIDEALNATDASDNETYDDKRFLWDVIGRDLLAALHISTKNPTYPPLDSA